MPAVTADYLRLPRLDGPPREAIERPVLSVTTAPTGLEGEGFPVHRPLPACLMRCLIRSCTWTRWAR
jgi:hypothetical protein